MSLWDGVADALSGFVRSVLSNEGEARISLNTVTISSSSEPSPSIRDDGVPSATAQREKRVADATTAIARYEPDWTPAAFLAVAAPSIQEAAQARFRTEALSGELKWTEGFRRLVEQERKDDVDRGVKQELVEYVVQQAVVWDFREEVARLVLVVRASARRHERISDVTTGMVVKDDGPQDGTTGEFWSFVRPVTAMERAPGHVAARDPSTGKCPSCGAAYPAQFQANCPYCGTPIAAWPGGWLVAGMSRTSVEYQIL